MRVMASSFFGCLYRSPNTSTVDNKFSSGLPAAKSGIMAGIVLGIGRAIGETMAVIMVAGNHPNVAGVIGTAVAAGTFMAIFGVK